MHFDYMSKRLQLCRVESYIIYQMTCLQFLVKMFLVALGVLPPAPLPGIATVGLVSKQSIEGDEYFYDC